MQAASRLLLTPRPACRHAGCCTAGIAACVLAASVGIHPAPSVSAGSPCWSWGCELAVLTTAWHLPKRWWWLCGWKGAGALVRCCTHWKVEPRDTLSTPVCLHAESRGISGLSSLDLQHRDAPGSVSVTVKKLWKGNVPLSKRVKRSASKFVRSSRACYYALEAQWSFSAAQT